MPDSLQDLESRRAGLVKQIAGLGEDRGRAVDLDGLVLQPVFGEHQRGRAERVRLQDVGASLQVPAADGADRVVTSERPDIAERGQESFAQRVPPRPPYSPPRTKSPLNSSSRDGHGSSKSFLQTGPGVSHLLPP